MEYTSIIENWRSFAAAIKNLGGDVQAFVIEDPATEREINTFEERTGLFLPESLKEVLLNLSKKVEFRWFLPVGFELEGELVSIFSGDRHWSLDRIYKCNESKNTWVKECFPNKDNSYDALWHNKFAFHDVRNGDFIAIDISSSEYQPVVYLSHDDGDGHGVKLAKSFKDFVYQSSLIGCVGGEDFQQLPFIEKGRKYINGNSKNACNFRAKLCINNLY